jgi:hypothetical protein
LIKYKSIRHTAVILLIGIPALQAASDGVRQESIFDPNFKMPAYNLHVPAKWKFDGVFVPGSSCVNTPFPVFRMYSPDGLSEVRRYPRVDWVWSNTAVTGAPHPDCLNLKKALTAKEFLQYIMGVLQVAYVRDAPIPQEMVESRQKQIRQMNAKSVENSKMLRTEPAVQTFDFAAVYAEYRNGTFTIEEHLQAAVNCIRNPLSQVAQRGSFMEQCNANIRVVRAPKGQLAGLMKMVEADYIGAGENVDWAIKYTQAVMAKNAAIMQKMHQDFERSQVIRAQQHQQFLANMQAGTDRSMANARAVANSNHAIAQDWCDYSLNQQTVTGAGGTVKVSSAYTQTWTNGSGQYYQTNDPNTNPNGVLSGAWTQTTKVHGDGTPY